MIALSQTQLSRGKASDSKAAQTRTGGWRANWTGFVAFSVPLMASAVMEVLSSPDATAMEVRGELDGFVRQVAGLRKAGSFSAADAKTYGPMLIKMVNACVKQVRLPCNSESDLTNRANAKLPQPLPRAQLRQLGNPCNTHIVSDNQAAYALTILCPW